MIKRRTLYAHANLTCGALQCALLSRARGCLRIAREQLQLAGPGGEVGELEHESLDGSRRRRLLEPGLEWRGDALGIRGRVLEQDRGEPGARAFEIRTQSDRVHAPADAAWMFAPAREPRLARVREQLALTHRREERERGHDRLRRASCFARPRG